MERCYTGINFDINKIKTSRNLKSEILANELLKYPDADIFICGDNEVWLHVSNDEKTIILDMENLDMDIYNGKLNKDLVDKFPTKVATCNCCGNAVFEEEHVFTDMHGVKKSLYSYNCSGTECMYNKKQFFESKLQSKIELEKITAKNEDEYMKLKEI